MLITTQTVLVDEQLPFTMDDGFEGEGRQPYVRDLLTCAQLQHKIFEDESIIKAFYEVEKAHRGHMRANGDPYLQHCVETSMLLANIRANSTVVVPGILHDILDDSFKHLHLDKHHEMTVMLEDSFDEAMITYAIEKLEQAPEKSKEKPPIVGDAVEEDLVEDLEFRSRSQET